MEKIKIDRFYVIVEEIDGKKTAELVGVDKQMNEYRMESNVYVMGEIVKVQTDIVCTERSLQEKLKRGL
jgi:hypothetical protein